MRTHTELESARQGSLLQRVALILFASMSVPLPVFAFSDATMAALDKAVSIAASDFNPDIEATNRAMRDLASTPEWRDPLWDRFTRGYFEGEPLTFRTRDALGASWAVYLDLLASRNDLSEAQVARVTEEMRRIYARPFAELMGEDMFIDIGVKMLKHYPSKDHEDLCLAALEWPPPNVLGWLLCRVSETLAETGTEAALKRLKAAADKVNGLIPGYKAARSVEFEPNIQALESRLAAERARASSSGSLVATLRERPTTGKSSGEESRGEAGSPRPSFAWEIAAVVSGVAGLLALAKYRSVKRG